MAISEDRGIEIDEELEFFEVRLHSLIKWNYV